MTQLDFYTPCLKSLVLRQTAGPLGNPAVVDPRLRLPSNLREFQLSNDYWILERAYIQSLPQSLSELTQLQKLQIYGLDVIEHPQDWSGFVNLEVVDLNTIEIDSWLPAFTTLPKLKLLRLSIPYFAPPGNTPTIPPAFANLADTLEELDVSGCRITDPAERQRVQGLLPATRIRFE